ncbi:MAG: hypothetical protein ABH868_05660 [bacterium]
MWTVFSLIFLTGCKPSKIDGKRSPQSGGKSPTAVVDRQYQRFWVHQSKADVYAKLGKYEDAIAEYKEMIKLDSESKLSYQRIEKAYSLLSKQRKLTAPEEKKRKENMNLMKKLKKKKPEKGDS